MMPMIKITDESARVRFVRIEPGEVQEMYQEGHLTTIELSDGRDFSCEQDIDDVAAALNLDPIDLTRDD